MTVDAILARVNGPAMRPGKRLRVLSARTLMDAPPRSYLLDGLLAPRELSVHWGQPKCGKSFLLLRLAYGLALGVGMWGRAVPRPLRVLYLAAEGEGGIGNRLRALHDEMGDAGDAFAVIAQRMELGPPSTDLAEVIAAAKAHRADLVVVDTLARTFGAGNEDAAMDMGGFIAAMDVLREETGAHVAVIHHGAKDESSKTPRGSGALLGAADLVVKVAKGGARVDYAKDDADGADLAFDLRVVEIGKRPDGSAITTCLAVEGGGAVAPGKSRDAERRLSDANGLLLRALRDVVAGDDVEHVIPVPGMPRVAAVKRPALRAALMQAAWYRPDELREGVSDPGNAIERRGQTREHKALEALKAKSLAGFTREWAWLT
ncbi:AAA family ATPase [Falsiroseomonas tokyonensis]|uniref:AAA family ATPase n=1 Tax=Falsiroseomonas tokyonensis TaxID=430521 RepID=A0ABV7C1K2_9PROT|nr:AAA family ATPase [Falsiroseomonas tokyonensis]MBU8540000.1 AAA family ATPase [Falsiroseomonas tokyonensis]